MGSCRWKTSFDWVSHWCGRYTTHGDSPEAVITPMVVQDTAIVVVAAQFLVRTKRMIFHWRHGSENMLRGKKQSLLSSLRVDGWPAWLHPAHSSDLGELK